MGARRPAPPAAPVRHPRGGRPAADTREVVNAIFHLRRGGPAWRTRPHDAPARPAVYARFRPRRPAGVWDEAHAALREEVRIDAGYPPTPETLRVDRPTVETTHRGGPRGYGGGEKVRGRKRVIGVASLGLLRARLVTPASGRDRDAGRWPPPGPPGNASRGSGR